ncbi:hypothetical protein [Streptomyces sp. NBC_01716]|uniref:hypothetical protein n=1 Tax=Streptomyces sp. NBC_01716 TaxID=2975917 RepID=UPI002E34D6E2|nr:hypothetical protein [Streptomyces sp. NBC_01716]
MTQLIESYDGLPGHHLLTDSGMGHVRAGTEAVGRVLDSAAVKRVHLPDIVASQALADARPLLSPDARIIPVTTAFSEQACGALPIAGICLQALPVLRGRQWSHRDLPRGCYTVGPASPPVSAGQEEDVVCVSGVLLTETPKAANAFMDDALGRLLPGLGHEDGHWGLTAPARIWSRSGRVLAVAQGADQSALPSRLRIRYATRDSSHGTATVTFFYFSELALLDLGGER